MDNSASAEHRKIAAFQEPVLQTRRAGVLLPITALPARAVATTVDASSCGVFDMACRFIDWIASAGFSVWQLLPMGPTQIDRSPYLCLSSLAGESQFIGLDWLQKIGLLEILPAQQVSTHDSHSLALKTAHHRFQQLAPDHHLQRTYHQFCNQARQWLPDFALFVALHQQLNQSWQQWPAALRDRDPEALTASQEQLREQIAIIQFAQFLFFQQWSEIRDYARQRGVFLFGDMPLFVAHDSADVWANRDYFKLTADGRPEVVAGVPADYFSPTGQRWGNPHYHWDNLQRDRFSWWLQRLQVHVNMFDLLRIDHFRGLCSAWEIPATSPTAESGHWQPAAGEPLLAALTECLSSTQPQFLHPQSQLPLVAEDLGLITPEVINLRDQFNLPGMAVLQFAFDGGSDNPYLPENLKTWSVLYTGTHDNDTTLSWFLSLSEQQQKQVTDYLHCSAERMPLALVEAALISRAQLAVIPLQDILGLGSGNRINTPGTVGNNWLWQIQWQQLTEAIAKQFLSLNIASGRCQNDSAI